MNLYPKDYKQKKIGGSFDDKNIGQRRESKKCLIFFKSNNKEIMTGFDIDEIIEKI